jgi:hypothetical protein
MVFTITDKGAREARGYQRDILVEALVALGTELRPHFTYRQAIAYIVPLIRPFPHVGPSATSVFKALVARGYIVQTQE